MLGRGSRRVFALLCSLLIPIFGIPAPTAYAITPANQISYVYDELGRLEAVVDPAASNGIAHYNYDGVGNLLSITRQNAAVDTVLDFHPKTAKVGQKVTIYGAGFNPDISQDTVRFGGSATCTGGTTVSTYVSATATQLQVLVPSGGVGQISVAVAPSSCARSSQSFSLDSSTAPTITGFSPSVALVGSVLTISGSGFDASSAARNSVFLNGIRAQVTSATATTLSALVPPFLTSGRITVRTAYGQATSTADFVVPPLNDQGIPFTPADLETVVRTQVGVPATVTVNTSGKVGVVMFDATKNERVFVDATQGTIFLSSVTILDPFGRAVGLPTNVGVGQYVDTSTLSVPGTYRILVDPLSTNTGSLTVVIRDVAPDLTGTVVLGTPLTPTLAIGQNGMYTFQGTTGQRVSLTTSASTMSGFARVLDPSGFAVFETGFGGSTNFQEPVALPVSGTYTLQVDPTGNNAGSSTFTLYDVPPDVTGPITPSGSSVNVSIGTPGQNARYTFTGSPNQRVSVLSTNSTISQGKLSIFPSSGPFVSETNIGSGTGFLDTTVLPANDTYTIVVDPTAERTGSLTLNAYNVPADPTPQMTIGGPSVNLSLLVPGQNAHPTFQGTAGQTVRLTMTNSTISLATLNIWDPNGSRIASAPVGTGNATLDTPVLSLTGTYKIDVDPDASRTGTMTIALSLLSGPGPAAGRAPVVTQDQGAATGTSAEAAPTRDSQAAIAGRVLRVDGVPLEGVTVAIGTASTRTDSLGRFVLKAAPPGDQVLVVDGASASTTSVMYGLFQIHVNLVPGVTTELGFTIWMPTLDTTHSVRIASPTRREVVLKTPLMPGLEIHIPKGSVITDTDGNVVHELSITPVPVDRPPFPMPEGPGFPSYFTVQPGGASILPQGARIVYPNETGLPPGTEVPFMQYEPSENGWESYGGGRVDASGKQIIPTPGTRIDAFTGSSAPIKAHDPALLDVHLDSQDGDPIDLSTGLFAYTKTDISLPGPMPIDLTRVYRQSDANAYPFGLGMTYSYEAYLLFEPTNQWIDLVLPGDVRVRFNRITTGTDVQHAVLEATSTPGPYFKARISWDPVPHSWRLVQRDGTVMLFGQAGSTSVMRDLADRFGNHLVILGANGTAPGLATQIVSYPSGRWLNLTNANGRITQATDNTGRSIAYGYDGSGRLTTVTDPNQFGQPSPLSTTIAWGSDPDCTNPTSQIASITDPRGITFLANTYGPGCRVTQQTVSTASSTDSYSIVYTPSVAGPVTQADVTDPNGNIRRVTFDSSGYQSAETLALGTSVARTFTTERDPANHRTTAVVDSFHNRRTEYAYTPLGQLSSITKLAGTGQALTTQFTYEPVFHQLETITDPTPHVTRFGYDSSGCLDTAKDAANRTTNFDCNAAGEITSITDPLTHTTSFSYAQGDLISSTDPLGAVSSRLVDDGGRVLSVTDPLNYVTSYQYDKLNQLTKVTNAQAKAISFFYDEDGNLKQVKDERNATPSNTFFSYNNMNLVSARTDPLGHVESFSYDDMGYPTFWTDRKGQVTEFQYDPLNRVKFAGFKRTGTNHITYESKIDYTYDGGGRLSGIADNATNAGTVTRGFNDLDQLISESSVNSTAIAYTYNPDGTRFTMTVPNQSQITYGYNPAGQLTSLSQGGNTTAQDYFDDGRLRSITYPSTSGPLKQAYEYDVVGQVNRITYQRGANPVDDLWYSYDSAGRRTAVYGTYARTGLPSATTSSGVYDLANRLTSWNGSSVSNDLNGNMTSQGGLTYTYNARNQLATAKQGSTTLGSFVYDGLGRRVSKTLSGVVTKFVYDGWNPVQEQASNNQVNFNLLVGPNLDQWFSRTPPSPGQSSYFLSDALGSTVAVTDSAGAVSTSYTYEPYGKTTISGSSTNPFQFTGRENDSAGALALYEMRTRYYSPTLQRFQTEDQIGFSSGDTNLYAYATDGPTYAVDHLGEKGGSNLPSPSSVMAGRKDGCSPGSCIFDAVQRFCDTLGKTQVIDCTPESGEEIRTALEWWGNAGDMLDYLKSISGNLEWLSGAAESVSGSAEQVIESEGPEVVVWIVIIVEVA